MCGRFTLTASPDDLKARFGVDPGDLDVTPRYNVAPTDNVLTVVNRGQVRAQMMRWGLIPFWAKDAKIGSRMINARAESVVEKSAFREAFQRRRCLVVADGFYEWRKEGKLRVPMRVILNSSEVFGFAGLWETWKAPDGELVRSCTIVTTVANSLLAPVHDRMPVILSREAEACWLDTSVTDTAELRELLLPYPSSEMHVYEVSPVVNKVDNDTPECIIPVPSGRLAL